MTLLLVSYLGKNRDQLLPRILTLPTRCNIERAAVHFNTADFDALLQHTKSIGTSSNCEGKSDNTS